MMNKKGLIIILGFKSSLIPFSKALQKIGREVERGEKEKVHKEKEKTKRGL